MALKPEDAPVVAEVAARLFAAASPNVSPKADAIDNAVASAARIVEAAKAACPAE